MTPPTYPVIDIVAFALAGPLAVFVVLIVYRFIRSRLAESVPALPNPPQPTNGMERDYVMMMYEEHAEHARQHETLRAAVAGFVIALVAGLLAAPGNEHHPRQEIIGITICVVSLLGLLLNATHYERYRLHLAVLRGYRKAFEQVVNDELAGINRRCRRIHEREYRLLSGLRLHHLWFCVYVMTLAVGLLWVWLGYCGKSHQELTSRVIPDGIMRALNCICANPPSE